ncbi:copper amine oxidase N-terminal domain-containing protein [Calidifontibacillus oryziterrae]|uniref:copper amine oxidase N-terminal domain-containing protein n=1 Tax=Calidifontibacillus oryziterrae TaxID=1191699 RepID=UPI00030F02FD|nr:copper amine oxidase N-terminal domain-containing protein [Calidifontibacillus oryziterrae]
MKKNHVIALTVIACSVVSFSMIANADDDVRHRKESDEQYWFKDYRNDKFYDDYDYHPYDDDDHEGDDYGNDRDDRVNYDDDNDDYDNDYDDHADDDDDYADDNDDHDDDDNDDYDNDYDDDDEDEYDEFDYDHDEPATTVSKEYWFKWSRSATEPNEIEPMPLTEPSVLSLVIDKQNSVKINVIPTGSQLMVPIEEVAQLVEAEVTVYPKSEIIEINKENKQLIVRNNSKVVYENMRKTPMQVVVMDQNEKYYIPLSVLANGLGYEINENIKNNQITLERIPQL